MYRLSLVLTPLLLACLFVPGIRGEDKDALRQALALEEALRDAIKQAEPSVVCILVSRSDAYSKLFHDSPPADDPGRLGAFDPAKRAFTNRHSPGDDLTDIQEDNRKYDLADARTVPEAFGSGVVIDGQGPLILTAYHVVRDATKVYVRLPGGKGSYADIHAADPRSDLAVLRLVSRNLPPLKAIKFGNGERVQKGQFVVSLANPYAAGFRDGSAAASWGILSNIRQRAASWPGDEEEDPREGPRALYLHGTLLQTDARLNLTKDVHEASPHPLGVVGCSGGALLNLRGEMIGLTTARAAISGSETAGGFAVPLDPSMKRIIDKLREGVEVEYGFLGVTTSPANAAGGVRIGQPIPGSPANKASLQANDVIESINGVPLREADDLYPTVATVLAGSEARLAVRGRPKPVIVTLAKSYVRGKIIFSKKPPAVRGIRVDYTSTLFLQQDRRVAFFGRQEIHAGVIVREVEPNSRAATYLKLNDVITHIKIRDTEVAVNSPAEFYREAAKVGSNEPLQLTLLNAEWHRGSPPKVTIP